MHAPPPVVCSSCLWKQATEDTEVGHVSSADAPSLRLPGCAVGSVDPPKIQARLTSLQRAFLNEGAVQCGFCIPGQVMAADDLLRRTPRPTLAEVQEGLAGNLCRCGCYGQITQAVLAAADEGGR